jgi:hypothetical protein
MEAACPGGFLLTDKFALRLMKQHEVKRSIMKQTEATRSKMKQHEAT